MDKKDTRIPSRSQAETSKEPHGSLFFNFLEFRPLSRVAHQGGHSESEDTNQALHFLYEQNLEQMYHKVREAAGNSDSAKSPCLDSTMFPYFIH